MNTTSTFIVAGLSSCLFGLTACRSGDDAPLDLDRINPSLHRVTLTTATGAPRTTPMRGEALPTRQALFALPSLPRFRHAPRSYAVQTPELPTRVTADMAARWTALAPPEPPRLSSPSELVSDGIERNPLAQRCSDSAHRTAAQEPLCTDSGA